MEMIECFVWKKKYIEKFGVENLDIYFAIDYPLTLDVSGYFFKYCAENNKSLEQLTDEEFNMLLEIGSKEE